MQLNNLYSYLAACLVLGGVFLAWRGLDLESSRPQATPQGEEAAGALPRVVQPTVASNPTDSTERAPPPVKLPDPSPLPPQVSDDYPKGWDELASADRVEHLEGRFTAALAAIEAGEQPIVKHAFRAESALTSMRAELYGTASGRAKHRLHESRLDHVLGEAVPVAPELEGASR
ncbi:MAG: hypothetical protein KBF28_05010 [Gemmatimonadales bacterium]|nr:hypothetical protein [Gemmatimonadales bacterium]